MKQRPSATAVRLTRFFQGIAVLAVIKLVALSMLWIAPHAPDLALDPVAAQTAMAAAKADKTEKSAAKKDTKATNATAEAPKTTSTATANATASPEPPAQPEKSLAEQLQDLRTRQGELDKKETDLRSLELELDKKLENLKTLEAKMQKMIEEGNTLRDEKMRHLVDVYSNMKPKQAAGVLETLDESIAVRILAGMSGRKAGEILSSVSAARAAKLSEALTKLQTK